MTVTVHTWRLLFTGIMFFHLHATAAVLPNPKERIDYWRNNYTELTVQKDARVEVAQSVFNRVLQAAGNRHGIHPRLYILSQDPLNISLPISIPDGWIIISKNVLDMCYQQRQGAEDKLAFILSHEIAHLLDDDFWHINFFNAVDISKRKGTSDPDILDDLITIVGSVDKIAAKELRADENGILYTSMAGFDVNQIINVDSNKNFFQQWEALLDIHRISAGKHSKKNAQQKSVHKNNVHKNNVHPSKEQRTAAVLARLQQIADQAELFQLGLLFYQAGKFELSVNAFNEFLRYYPGREVHHNLAASYHQLALMYYPDNHGPDNYDSDKHDSDKHDSDNQSLDDNGIDKRNTIRSHQAYNRLEFKYSISVDAHSRASQMIFRGNSKEKNLYTKNISNAIYYYQAAIKQDSNYLLSYQNLGSAFILNGEPFKAIAILKDGFEIAKQNPVTLNLLGIAFYFAENNKKAIEYLELASRLDKKYSDPVFNLGKIAKLEGRSKDAQLYWEKYLDLDSNSYWVNLLETKYGVGKPAARQRGLTRVDSEKLMNLQVGNYSDEVPMVWGKPHSNSYPLRETPYISANYKNGITTVAEGDEIRMLVAGSLFKGRSGRGIAIGDKTYSIVKAYGRPPLSLNATLGKSLAYPDKGITFQVRNNKVVSWVIY